MSIIDTQTVFASGGCDFRYTVDGFAVVAGPCLVKIDGSYVDVREGTPVSGFATGFNAPPACGLWNECSVVYIPEEVKPSPVVTPEPDYFVVFLIGLILVVLALDLKFNGEASE